MATTKAAKKRRRIRNRHARRYRIVTRSFSDKEMEWRTWNHDLDTYIHEAVKNPALVKLTIKQLLKRGEQFADEMKALQERRRPAGVTYSGRY